MAESDVAQEAADRLEIMQVLYRYCRSMDRIDNELGYSIWNEGAIADYGPNIFRGTGREYIDQCLEQHRRCRNHTHQITNTILEINGDRAVSEAYFYSVLRAEMKGSPVQFSTWGRYIDEWSRANGRWGIDKRTTVRDFDEVSDYQEGSHDDIGRRDRTDPSYAVFASIR